MKGIVRTFALFTAGIVVPAGFLSYWGFRSFQYEGMLMRKQGEERCATVADLAQKKLEEELANLVRNFRASTLRPGVQRFDPGEMLSFISAPQDIQGLPVENLFIFNEQDRMIAPWSLSAPASAGED